MSIWIYFWPSPRAKVGVLRVKYNAHSVVCCSQLDNFLTISQCHWWKSEAGTFSLFLSDPWPINSQHSILCLICFWRHHLGWVKPFSIDRFPGSLLLALSLTLFLPLPVSSVSKGEKSHLSLNWCCKCVESLVFHCFFVCLPLLFFSVYKRNLRFPGRHNIVLWILYVSLVSFIFERANVTHVLIQSI